MPQSVADRQVLTYSFLAHVILKLLSTHKFFGAAVSRDYEKPWQVKVAIVGLFVASSRFDLQVRITLFIRLSEVTGFNHDFGKLTLFLGLRQTYSAFVYMNRNLV